MEMVFGVLKFKFNSMSLFRTPVQKLAQAGALALKVPRFRSKNDFAPLALCTRFKGSTTVTLSGVIAHL